MEVHSVLPEERARTEKGEALPWGYRYADASRNTREPTESGPFGRNRSLRMHSAGRRSVTRQTTTPARQQSNTAVDDFSRIFAKEQAATTRPSQSEDSSNVGANTTISRPEPVSTECILYGYRDKGSEWKVLSKYEQIVAQSVVSSTGAIVQQGYICEDYPRTDPTGFVMDSPGTYNRNNITIHKNLSRAAMQKASTYMGGEHWIKVTFDSYESAERACWFSPLEIEGYNVFCEIWSGRGPASDTAILKEGDAVLERGLTRRRQNEEKANTISQTTVRQSGLQGFEAALKRDTLPRSHKSPDVQYGQPHDRQKEQESPTTTMSSATATGMEMQEVDSQARGQNEGAQSTPQRSTSSNEFMSRTPQVRKAILRPISEALPPQESFLERVVKLIPLYSWLTGSNTVAITKQEIQNGRVVNVVIDPKQGPILREDGSWDAISNGWYWSFWHSIDQWFGSDFCGLKED